MLARQPFRASGLAVMATPSLKRAEGVPSKWMQGLNLLKGLMGFERAQQAAGFKRRALDDAARAGLNPLHLSAYTVEALDNRCNLRYDREVLHALHAWWDAIVSHLRSLLKDPTRVEEAEYSTIFKKAGLHVPSARDLCT